MNRPALAALAFLGMLTVCQAQTSLPSPRVLTMPPGSGLSTNPDLNGRAASTGYVDNAQTPSVGAATGTIIRGNVSMPAATAGVPINAHNPANTPQPDGVFISGKPNVDYCSIGGCFDGPHLKSNLLINSTTIDGVNAQENALAINFTSNQGRATRWLPNTAFTTGSYHQNFNSICSASVGGSVQNDLSGCIYQVVSGGTSASSGNGPTGNGQSIQDGTVVWKLIGPGTNTGKTGLNIACTLEGQGGTTWCTNFNFSVKQIGEGTAWGEEKDCNNNNEDSSAGSRFLMACTFYGGGSAGNFPFLAYQFVGSGSVNSGGAQPYGAHQFIFIAGQPGDVGSVIKDDVILDGGHSATTIHALGGRNHATAFLFDESNSDVSLKVGGSHRVGVELSNGTYTSGSAITLPSTSYLAWITGSTPTWFTGYNGSVGAYTLGNTNSGTGYSAASWTNGDLSYASHLWSRGPAAIVSACSTGAIMTGGNDDSGVISLATGSTGCTITFVAARTNKPSCVASLTSGGGPAMSVTTASVTFAFSSAAPSTELHYQCMGR